MNIDRAEQSGTPEKSTENLVSNQQRYSFLIPWINTSSLTDIRLYFLLQPVFWLLGVELIAPVFLAPWMFIKYIFTRQKILLPRNSWFLILLFFWQALHILTIPAAERGIFLKSLGTSLALICIYILVYNLGTNHNRWYRLMDIAEQFGIILIILGTLFILNIWTGEIQSVLGRFLPSSLTENSSFFGSISNRSLGNLNPVVGSRRVQATIWHPSSYATILLVIFAVLLFQYNRHKSITRLVFIGLTLLNLIFTYSRTTYVSFIILVLLFWYLNKPKYLPRILKFILLISIFTAVFLGVLYVFLSTGTLNTDFFTDIVYNFRPESILVRLEIYQESFNLILQKPIWGWGTLVEIEGLPSYFSAGSHSDYLSIIFFFGIPGFLLYLGFILSVWKHLILGYKQSFDDLSKSFFVISIALMAAINIRQLTSVLQWDIYVASTIWLLWGLAVVKHRSMSLLHLQNKHT